MSSLMLKSIVGLSQSSRKSHGMKTRKWQDTSSILKEKMLHAHWSRGRQASYRTYVGQNGRRGEHDNFWGCPSRSPAKGVALVTKVPRAPPGQWQDKSKGAWGHRHNFLRNATAAWERKTLASALKTYNYDVGTVQIHWLVQCNPRYQFFRMDEDMELLLVPIWSWSRVGHDFCHQTKERVGRASHP